MADNRRNDEAWLHDELDVGEQEAPGSRRRLVLVAVFLVVALASMGAYALYRHFSRPVETAVDEQTDADPVEAEPDPVDLVVERLTLEQKVAQLFVVTPESITETYLATEAGERTRDGLARYPVGGIVYFAQNLQDPQQTKELLHKTRNYAVDACGLVPFLCVDEEGGSVVRIADNPAFGVQNVGHASYIGSLGDVELARSTAHTIGDYLYELGFNVDFAPVCDIATAPDGTMYLRSFGDTPDVVGPMAAAQVDGFMRSGVLCSAKHFPGIGGAEGDSHNGRIYSHKTADEMASWDLVPFQAAIDAGVPMIMVGHLSCLELANGEGDLPASMSHAVITDLLRGRLGYDGIVVTDSLSMGAVEDVCAPSEQAVYAIEAGADLVLMPTDFSEAYEGLLWAVRSGDVSEERIDESVRRIVRIKLELR